MANEETASEKASRGLRTQEDHQGAVGIECGGPQGMDDGW